MTDRATVAFDKDDKDVIDEAQERLADELGGITPSKGETVVHLAKNYVENDD